MAENKQSKAPPPRVHDLDELGWIGHIIPAALGLTSLIAAFYAQRSHIQITLTVALLVIGVLLPWLAWLSFQRSRAGWSFLIASTIVLGVMTLFGAPKIGSLTDMHVGGALGIPAAFGLAAFALAMQSHRYKT